MNQCELKIFNSFDEYPNLPFFFFESMLKLSIFLFCVTNKINLLKFFVQIRFLRSENKLNQEIKSILLEFHKVSTNVFLFFFFFFFFFFYFFSLFSASKSKIKIKIMNWTFCFGKFRYWLLLLLLLLLMLDR